MKASPPERSLIQGQRVAHHLAKGALTQRAPSMGPTHQTVERNLVGENVKISYDVRRRERKGAALGRNCRTIADHIERYIPRGHGHGSHVHAGRNMDPLRLGPIMNDDIRRPLQKSKNMYLID